MTRAIKYQHAATDPGGTPLAWPGTSLGFPFRGRVPTALKAHEYESLGHVLDAHTEVLTLPDDLKRYDEIQDRIVNGLWLLRRETEPVRDAATGKYSVLVSWVEPYGVAPPPRNPYDADIDEHRQTRQSRQRFAASSPWSFG